MVSRPRPSPRAALESFAPWPGCAGVPAATPAPVRAYLAAQPPPQRAALKRITKQILAVAPDAKQRISYQIIGFEQGGRMLVWIMGAKKHCSMFPPTLRFDPVEGLSDAAVRRFVKRRLKENEAAEAKRSAKKARARKAIARSASSRAPRRVRR